MSLDPNRELPEGELCEIFKFWSESKSVKSVCKLNASASGRPRDLLDWTKSRRSLGYGPRMKLPDAPTVSLAEEHCGASLDSAYDKQQSRNELTIVML